MYDSGIYILLNKAVIGQIYTISMNRQWWFLNGLLVHIITKVKWGMKENIALSQAKQKENHTGKKDMQCMWHFWSPEQVDRKKYTYILGVKNTSKLMWNLWL